MSSPGPLHGDNIGPVCGYDAAICKRPESISPVRGILEGICLAVAGNGVPAGE